MSTTKRDIPTSWFAAERFLGRKATRNIGKSGRVYRDGTDMVLRYHNTPIIVWHQDGTVYINHGGWTTVSTKSWLNHALAMTPFRVYTRRHITYVQSFLDGAVRMNRVFDRPLVLNVNTGVVLQAA